MSKINFNKISPPENIPDDLEVPEKTIYILTNSDEYLDVYENFLEPDTKSRPWFLDHFYFCLPLSVGNQHGFIIKSQHDVLLRWDGNHSTDALSVFVDDSMNKEFGQSFESHFGSGILTVQHEFTLRTPKGVNLMVKEPPNYVLPGLTVMNAVIETDQLRRDFTYNIKVNEAHKDIFIPKGTPLAAVVPYPRYFHDEFVTEVVKNEKNLDTFRRTLKYFNEERSVEYENRTPSLRYMHGEDIFGNKFEEHQKTLDNGVRWKKINE